MMNKGVVVMDLGDEELKPADFLYCGKRLLADRKPAYEILVEGDDKPRLYTWHASASRKAIGGLYSGASFGTSTAKGLQGASFVRMAASKTQYALWRAADEEAELALKEERLQASAKKINQIDEWMLPLRQLYHNSMNSLDRQALMHAMQRSLLKPPPKGKS